MTRYIDADALKEMICSHVYPVVDYFNSKDYGMFWTGGIEKAIDEQPTIDAVPVIRCKDCTYWDSEITQTAVPNMRSCIYWGRIGTLGIDYCSRAVRKEE